jgi:hypothetical protein
MVVIFHEDHDACHLNPSEPQDTDVNKSFPDSPARPSQLGGREVSVMMDLLHLDCWYDSAQRPLEMSEPPIVAKQDAKLVFKDRTD